MEFVHERGEICHLYCSCYEVWRSAVSSNPSGDWEGARAKINFRALLALNLTTGGNSFTAQM